MIILLFTTQNRKHISGPAKIGPVWLYHALFARLHDTTRPRDLPDLDYPNDLKTYALTEGKRYELFMHSFRSPGALCKDLTKRKSHIYNTASVLGASRHRQWRYQAPSLSRCLGESLRNNIVTLTNSFWANKVGPDFRGIPRNLSFLYQWVL